MQRRTILSQKSSNYTSLHKPRQPLVTKSTDICPFKLPRQTSVHTIRQCSLLQSRRFSSSLMRLNCGERDSHGAGSKDLSFLNALKGSHIKGRFMSKSQITNQFMSKTLGQFFIKKAYSMNAEPSAHKLISQIGFGSLGKIWKVSENSTQKVFAMKILNKKSIILNGTIQCVINERAILSQLQHNFIINMHSAFQDEANLYLTADYLRGGDLRYHLCYRQCFQQEEARFIIACLIIAVEYLHEKGILHRDIKPENIVFQENGYPRLTEFGIAKRFTNGQFLTNSDYNGTPGYMAPEVILKESQSFVSDFFSIGIICYELVFACRPYIGANFKRIKERMEKYPVNIKPSELPYGWSASVTDFITKLLSRHPEARLGFQGIAELKEHPWMKSIKWEKLQSKTISPLFVPNVVCESRKYLREIQKFARVENDRTKDGQFQSIDLDDYKNYFEEYDYVDKRHSKKFHKQNEENKENTHSHSKLLKKRKRNSELFFHNV